MVDIAWPRAGGECLFVFRRGWSTVEIPRQGCLGDLLFIWWSLVTYVSPRGTFSFDRVHNLARLQERDLVPRFHHQFRGQPGYCWGEHSGMHEIRLVWHTWIQYCRTVRRHSPSRGNRERCGGNSGGETWQGGQNKGGTGVQDPPKTRHPIWLRSVVQRWTKNQSPTELTKTPRERNGMQRNQLQSGGFVGRRGKRGSLPGGLALPCRWTLYQSTP